MGAKSVDFFAIAQQCSVFLRGKIKERLECKFVFTFVSHFILFLFYFSASCNV
jgi:hypothetical protein